MAFCELIFFVIDSTFRGVYPALPDTEMPGQKLTNNLPGRAHNAPV
jgi:hypothetical protein